MKSFLSGLLVTILVVIIIGGLGYIGYSMFFMGDHSGMNMQGNTAPNNTTQNQVNTQGSNNPHGSMNMQGDSMNMKGGSNNMQSQPSNQYTLQQVNYALQNKESIDRTISMLNDVVKAVTTEPFSLSNTVSSPNAQQQNNNVQPNTLPGNIQQSNPTGNTQPNTVPGNTQQGTPGNAQPNNTTGVVQPNTPGTAANTQGNTTVNIYPPNAQQANNIVNSIMPNMGITYDVAKMEQFHTGLYKVAAGIESLKQLEEELMKQAEQAAVDVKDKTAYYANQYNMTLQSKSKLNQALYDINEASNLLNINPYISSNGVVYDKERMQQVHGNILKLAQSLTALNKLSSDMTKQAVTLIGTAQSYANSYSMDMSDHSNMPGMFSNLNISSIINILLIVFAGAFVIGLFGFISSLFKPSTPQS